MRATLDSIRWADEILVVDSYSSDNTLEICREFDAKILQHEYINSACQKNWAVAQCKHEWILQVDTDETFETGIEEEVTLAICSASADVHGFRFPRKNHILGKWVKYAGLYPDYQIRLFRRDMGRWAEREVHAHIKVPGRIGTLNHHILHQGMPKITNQLRNFDRYTRYEADELKKQGKHFHWSRLLLYPWWVFFYRFFFLQGWRNGWRGLIFCVYSGMYIFFMYAKLWEVEQLDLECSPR